jgi:hypothetical protein
VIWFLPLISVIAFSMLSLSRTCFSTLGTSFTLFRVKSTTHPVGGGTSSGSEDHGSGGPKEMTESARLSDVGSRSKVDDVVDRSRSFLFGPLTVTVSRIRGMIDSGYFVEGMDREPREETVLEP